MIKPEIKLKSLEKTVVHTKYKDDYTTLMQVYELAGWMMVCHQAENPTTLNLWESYEEDTAITAGLISQGNDQKRFVFDNVCDYLKEDRKIITPENFYALQGITKEKLDEINKYFEGKK